MNAHVETLRGIATDCRRGAHEHGMTAAGVRDIASRIDLAIAALEAQGEAYGYVTSNGVLLNKERRDEILLRNEVDDWYRKVVERATPVFLHPSSPAMRAVVEALRGIAALPLSSFPKRSVAGTMAVRLATEALANPEVNKLMGEE